MKPFKKVKYRNQIIPVFADDCGQCVYFKYKGVDYSCFNYLQEIIDVVDADLDNTFYIKSDIPHAPAAKVYQRHGVWYFDYRRFENLLLDYGLLLPKKERATKEKLIQIARTRMKRIDHYKADVML